MRRGVIGDNIGAGRVTVEVRLFNSITRYGKGSNGPRNLTLPVGTNVGELADQLEIPRRALHLVMVNGRDITPGLIGAEVRAEHQLEDGDVVAFSGPVPYSYGYGSPVV